MGKLPGKTAYSGIRRPTTRESGNSAHPDTTGGEWKDVKISSYVLKAGEYLIIHFSIPEHSKNSWIAFGGWYKANSDVGVVVVSQQMYLLTNPSSPNWSKFGAMWRGDGNPHYSNVMFVAKKDTTVNLWKTDCGIVHEPGCFTNGESIVCDTESYLKNMHLISPEAHIWKTLGYTDIEFDGSRGKAEVIESGSYIRLKSCNRCARFLPINTFNEREILSFSNHCVSRRPCVHPLFGRPKNVEDGSFLQLEYGFQLECRYCKKYCVNAALNKQRTSAQMKEDGARRRYFEYLIAELFQRSEQLAFKNENNIELADYIWRKFNGKCFNCDTQLHKLNLMALDHTRPLALLWPLDATATALCSSCNSSKSDRYPKEFYSAKKLKELSLITGIDINDLDNPSPNMKVVEQLVKNQKWLFDDFLMRGEMIRERDGKITGELVVKALQRVIDLSPYKNVVNLIDEYNVRRANT